MPRPELWITVVITIAALGAVHSSAFAQGTGRSMDFDISARSAALGNASTALPWGDLDHWANPALLGYVDGIRYAHQRTQLVPGLAPDVFFTTDYMQVGGGGLGVVFSGKPLDRGGVHLDYGQSEGIDESGNPTGLFDAYERVKAWGVGGSALRLIDNLFAATGHHMLRLSRYADVSAGITSKHTDIALAGPDGPVGKADSRDWGWLARVTPYDGLESGDVPIRVDATYGRSDINYHLDHLVVFINEDRASPVTRQHRRGVTVRASAGRLPRVWGTLLQGFTPLVSGTFTDDHIEWGVLDQVEYETDGHGVELTVANVFSYRRGHYQSLVEQIDGDTWGYGVALPIGKFAGAAYDDAHFPQANIPEIHGLHRKQFSAWIDPLAIWRATHTPPAAPGTR